MNKLINIGTAINVTPYNLRLTTPSFPIPIPLGISASIHVFFNAWEPTISCFLFPLTSRLCQHTKHKHTTLLSFLSLCFLATSTTETLKAKTLSFFFFSFFEIKNPNAPRRKENQNRKISKYKISPKTKNTRK